MGKAIEAIALERKHTIALAVSIENIEDNTIENIKKADVAIEFTGPEIAFDNICRCIDAGVPVVSGSTGWLQRFEEAKKYCLSHKGAFLYASNFSVGVNIFFAINKKLAEMMASHPDYDVFINEIHHTAKLDSPSGTAITLAEQVLQYNKHKDHWINPANAGHSAAQTELVILSERVDPAPGTHKVKYTSGIDDIEIIHTAHNRMGFAMGAVLAAEFLQKKTGIFTMQDVLAI